MSRANAVEIVRAYFDEGGILEDIGRRVAMRAESQVEVAQHILLAYLTKEMQPALERMEFSCRVLHDSIPGGGPFLLAEHQEDPELLTLFSYGHGDVIRGLENRWREGFLSWKIRQEGE